MILKITKDTDRVWKYKFRNVPALDEKTRQLIRDMKETLEFTGGVGLAAPQVGVPIRAFIADYGSLRETFINPKILTIGKETSGGEEGCLSIPGFRGLVKRPNQLTIEYIDAKGNKKQAKLTGFYARIIQHEYDHLSSVFYVDRITNKKKNLYEFEPIRIAFFGTNDFSATVLRSMIGQATVGEYNIPLVITAPPKLAGREQKPRVTAVETLAKQFDLPVEAPSWLVKKSKTDEKEKDERVVNEELIKKIKLAKADCIVVASYGKILPKEILNLPKHGAINVHASLLPKYRGASPIQAAIAAGEEFTGVTIMQMNEKMDEGPIIAQAKQRIGAKETYETLSAKLAPLGANLLNHVIHLWVAEKLKTKPQNPKKATYTKILTKEDGFIDLVKPPKNLSNLVRAYHPWPGVWTYYEVTSNKGQVTRKIIKLLPDQKVQLEGKKPVSLKEFRSGHKDFTLSW